MSVTSHFTLLREPKEASLHAIGSNGLTTLLAGGILNPFGPTLNVIATDGVIDEGRDLPIVRIMLNPFSQECHIVGRATIGSSWNPVEEIARFFGLPFGSCPTLLLPSAYLEQADAIALHAQFLQTFPDGSDVLTSVRKFPGDPWNRVQQAVGGMADRLRSFKSGAEEKDKSRPLTPGEADELATILLRSENLKAEIQAFVYAWKGSIDFQAESGSRALSEAALGPETFLGLFSAIAESCRLPDLGQ